MPVPSCHAVYSAVRRHRRPEIRRYGDRRPRPFASRCYQISIGKMEGSRRAVLFITTTVELIRQRLPQVCPAPPFRQVELPAHRPLQAARTPAVLSAIVVAQHALCRGQGNHRRWIVRTCTGGKASAYRVLGTRSFTIQIRAYQGAAFQLRTVKKRTRYHRTHPQHDLWSHGTR